MWYLYWFKMTNLLRGKKRSLEREKNLLRGKKTSCGKKRSFERTKKGRPVVLPRAGCIGTGVRAFGMGSPDLKLRSAIPICAAISQPALGNGIISVSQGRARLCCSHELISCSPAGEHLGGFGRPIWGQGYAAGNWRWNRGGATPSKRGEGHFSTAALSKGARAAQISEKHEC